MFNTPLKGVLVVALFAIASLSASAQEFIPRILNGLPAANEEFESVCIVGSLEFGGFCTGTLISPTHVLTAAHCAEVINHPTAGMIEIDGMVFLTSDIYSSAIHKNEGDDVGSKERVLLELENIRR